MKSGLKYGAALICVLVALGAAPSSAADLCAQGRIVNPKINGRPAYQFAGMPHVAFQQKSCGADGTCVYDILTRSGSAFTPYLTDFTIRRICTSVVEKRGRQERSTEQDRRLATTFDFNQVHTFSVQGMTTQRQRYELVVSSIYYSNSEKNTQPSIFFHGPSGDGAIADVGIQIFSLSTILMP